MKGVSFLLLVLTAILAIGPSAGADTWFTIDGVRDPEPPVLNVNDTVTIDLFCDDDDLYDFGYYFLGISEGSPASLDISGAIIDGWFEGGGASIGWVNNAEIAEILGIDNPFVEFNSCDVPPPVPPLPPPGPPYPMVNGIVLQCEGAGDVTLSMFDQNGNLLDEHLIHQVPEPGTIALFGLGMLMLKRKH